ncbi:unnamed protein product [Amoebophrya sp. A25]|nr:unnamed protein product [Amoebophrya sp. A25]|eukprot:GSA25T00006971001.1
MILSNCSTSRKITSAYYVYDHVYQRLTHCCCFCITTTPNHVACWCQAGKNKRNCVVYVLFPFNVGRRRFHFEKNISYALTTRRAELG